MQGGDLLIEYIAKRIRVEFPAGTAARMGGDLFVVATNEENIRERLRSLHASVAAYQDRISCEIKAGVYALDEAVHDAITASIDELQAFFVRLGMPSHLADFGIASDDLDPMIETLLLNKGEPFGAFMPLTMEDARTIYESAL